METISALSTGDIVTLLILAVILLAVLFVLRLIFKLTATLFRLGCFVVVAIVVGVAILMYLT